MSEWGNLYNHIDIKAHPNKHIHVKIIYVSVLTRFFCTRSLIKHVHYITQLSLQYHHYNNVIIPTLETMVCKPNTHKRNYHIL